MEQSNDTESNESTMETQVNPKQKQKKCDFQDTKEDFLGAGHRQRRRDRTGSKTAAQPSNNVTQQQLLKTGNEMNMLEKEVNDLQQLVQQYSDDKVELLQMFRHQQYKNEMLQTNAEENEKRLNEVTRSQSVEIKRLRERVDELDNLLETKTQKYNDDEEKLLERQQQLEYRNELLEAYFMTLLNDANQRGKKLLEEKDSLSATVDQLICLSKKERAENETLKIKVNDLQQLVQHYSDERKELLQMLKGLQHKNEFLHTPAPENDKRVQGVNRSQSTDIDRLREKVDDLDNLLRNPNPRPQPYNNDGQKLLDRRRRPSGSNAAGAAD